MKKPISCPKGYSCSSGVAYNFLNFDDEVKSPTPCPDNTYSNNVGSSQCSECPSGYECTCTRNDQEICINGNNF